jgi:N-acetylglutamate synthase-like GNAT family acetyltransferase
MTRLFGSLFLQYERGLWWYECFEYLRKFALTGFLVLLGGRHFTPYQRSIAGLATTLLCAMFAMNIRPFSFIVNDVYNQLILVVLFCDYFAACMMSIEVISLEENEVLCKFLQVINFLVVIAGWAQILVEFIIFRYELCSGCASEWFGLPSAKEFQTSLYKRYFDKETKKYFWINEATGDVSRNDPSMTMPLKAASKSGTILKSAAIAVTKVLSRVGQRKSRASSKIVPQDEDNIGGDVLKVKLRKLKEPFFASRRSLKEYKRILQNLPKVVQENIVVVQCQMSTNSRFVNYRPDGSKGVVVSSIQLVEDVENEGGQDIHSNSETKDFTVAKENNPLNEAGVKIGMHLISVDGRDCRGLSHLQVSELLGMTKHYSGHLVRALDDKVDRDKVRKIFGTSNSRRQYFDRLFERLEKDKAQGEKNHWWLGESDQKETLLVFAQPSAVASIPTLDCTDKYRAGSASLISVVVKPNSDPFVILEEIESHFGARVRGFREERFGGSPCEKEGVLIGMHLVSINEVDVQGERLSKIIGEIKAAKERGNGISLCFTKHHHDKVHKKIMAGKRKHHTKWIEKKDKKGRKYYKSIDGTKSVRHLPPLGIIVQSPDTNINSEETKSRKIEFIERKDKKGRTYYRNVKTGKSRWHLPPNGIIVNNEKAISKSKKFVEKESQEGKKILQKYRDGKDSLAPP